ncbi:MAG TPA: hypothetical protein VFZ11_08630 [Gemmatimonadaceae bacterium]
MTDREGGDPGTFGVYPRVNFEVIEDYGELHDGLRVNRVEPTVMLRIHLDIPIDRTDGDWGALKQILNGNNHNEKRRIRELVLQLAATYYANNPSAPGNPVRSREVITRALPD